VVLALPALRSARAESANSRQEDTIKYTLILFLTLAPSLMFGRVKHAPTVEQCQADQRLWFSRLEGGDSAKIPEPYDVLSEWASEMGECDKVDPPNRQKYYDTHSEIQAYQFVRVMDFMDRHDLWDKFKAEDAAGKR